MKNPIRLGSLLSVLMFSLVLLALLASARAWVDININTDYSGSASSLDLANAPGGDWGVNRLNLGAGATGKTISITSGTLTGIGPPRVGNTKYTALSIGGNNNTITIDGPTTMLHDASNMNWDQAAFRMSGTNTKLVVQNSGTFLEDGCTRFWDTTLLRVTGAGSVAHLDSGNNDGVERVNGIPRIQVDNGGVLYAGSFTYTDGANSGFAGNWQGTSPTDYAITVDGPNSVVSTKGFQWMDAGRTNGILHATNGGALELLASLKWDYTNNNKANFAHINIDGGGLSYKNCGATVNMNGNQEPTAEPDPSDFMYTGSNFFRLNNSTAVDTGSYMLASNLGAKNYTRLEMTNGTTSVARAITVDGENGGSMRFDSTAATISAGVTLLGTSTLEATGTPSKLTAVISGSGSLNKAGTGTLALASSNTYTGGTMIAAGVLMAGNNSAFGTNNDMTLSGGTLDLYGFNSIVKALNGGTGAIGNSQTSSNSLLTVTSGGTFGGNIQDHNGGGNSPLAMMLTGGALTLGGSNTYTGPTTVSAGTLNVTGSLAADSAVAVHDGGKLSCIGTIFGSVVVHGGGKLGGTGTISGPVTVFGGTTPATYGVIDLVDGSIGTLNLGNTLDLSVGSNHSLLNLEYGTSGNSFSFDRITTAGALALSGSGVLVSLTALGTTPVDGTYTILSAASGVTANFTFDGTSTVLTRDGKTYTLSTVGGRLEQITIGDASNNSKLWVGAEPSGSLASSASHSFGRILLSSTQSTTIILNYSGSDAATTNASVTATGGATTTTSGGTISNLSPINVTLSTGTLGVTSGTVTIDNLATANNGEGTGNHNGNAVITVDGTVVAQRMFTDTSAILGRFLADGTGSKVLSVSSAGANLVTTNGTLSSFTGTNDNNIGLTSLNSLIFSGTGANQKAEFSLGSSASKTGLLSYSFTTTVTDEFSTVIPSYPLVLTGTGTAVASRKVLDTMTDLGTYHAGATFSKPSNSFSYSYSNGIIDGIHSNTEDARVATYASTEKFDEGDGFTFSSEAQSISSSLGFSGTFSGTAVKSRTDSTTFKLAVTPELSGGTTANAGFSINVYSGNMAWSSSSGNWVTGSKWVDKTLNDADGSHVAPGLDENTAFKGTDTAAFNGTGANASETATVIDLSSVNPSLATLSFSNSGYRLTGGSLTMFDSSDGSRATINVSGGTDTIASLLSLAGTTEMTVDSTGRLNITGNIHGIGALLKEGAGILVLSGSNEYTGGTIVTAGTVVQASRASLPEGQSLTIGAGGTLIFDPSPIKDVVSGPIVWKLAESGNWSDPNKWTGGVPQFADAEAVINVPTSGTLTITLDVPETIGTLILGNSGDITKGYTLSGTSTNALTLNNFGNNATITVENGTHVIQATVDLTSGLVVSGSGTLAFGSSSSITGAGPLTMNGTGTLILSGSNDYVGGTFVTAGTMVQTSRASLPEGQSLTIRAGATFIYDPSFPTRAGPMVRLAGPVSFLTSPLAAGPVSMTLNPVPEPSTLALLVAGLVVGVGAWRKRKK